MPSSPDQPQIVLQYYTPNQRLRRLLLMVLVLLFVVFIILHNAAPLFVDWLWFGEVGYRQVFINTILAKTELYAMFAVFFFAFFYGNVAIARRCAPDTFITFLASRMGRQASGLLNRGVTWLLLAVSAFVSLWAGRIASDYWITWLQFRHAALFHTVDPVFHHDVSFYVLKLPFIQFLQGFCLAAIVVSSIAVVAITFVSRMAEVTTGLPTLGAAVRAHLTVLAGLFALVMAWGSRLSAWGLLTTDNGVFSGPGYVDLRYRLLSLNIALVVLVASGLGAISLCRSRRGPIIVGVGVGLWLADQLLIGGMLASASQKFTVEPNQLALESRYIARNIKFTRLGFGLGDVRQIDSFPADDSLTAAALRQNAATTNNVRLWDYNYLGKVYSQLQSVKTYYKFDKQSSTGDQVFNIDIDRYPVDGAERQVMLAPREMDPSGLPQSAQTWQNQKESFTHGYGLVMSPVNRDVDGAPSYLIKDIPLTDTDPSPSLRVTQPDIYYGMLTDGYVFTNTNQKEFDYPSTSSTTNAQDQYTTYTGTGGIKIGDSFWRKLAFSLVLPDINIFLAHNFTDSTRVLYRREVRDRIRTIAPFLQMDGDPYIVIDPDTGHLVWMIDCYTLSDQYPYSTPEPMAVSQDSYIAPNYIRNSIKATVDAYDGRVNFYLVDPKDPIAQSFSAMFPGMLKPFSAMPAGLRAHIRYPEDLFRLQRSVYASYHVQDPRVFYLKEDAWATPTVPSSDSSDPTPNPMEPYYVVMRLPGLGDSDSQTGQQEEFVLMSPLAPINREDKNILGWMCARCDGNEYGQLVLYRFPQAASVNGPSQILSLINSDPTISSQLALWRTGGSSATFGNLLVIPVEHSLLYIAPLYIESTSGDNKLPQLQKVVVAFGSREARVAMGNTLEDALTQLFPGYTGGTAPSSPAHAVPNAPGAGAAGQTAAVPQSVRSLVLSADQAYTTAQKQLRAGDFAGYGASMKQLKQAIDALAASTAAANRTQRGH
ncbi:MAG: UPF0182 family protein [Armatimonadetes bacterium]|nr:UPF0182 family protein [Armatimonadota bacterium]MDE2206255.1 UPF0182 family protein [Armatimonadota bacterium]